MEITEDNGRYRYHRKYADGSVLTFSAKDLRETATGVHGHIGILFNGAVLDSDLFNIGRGGDRQTLSNRAFKCLDKPYQEEYPAAQQSRLLGIFTLELVEIWRQRFTAKLSVGHRREGGIPLLLDPFIVEQGGTQFFGPPGAGKTYLCSLMAQSINHGISKFWRVKQSPVLYVNLERGEDGMVHRLALVNSILGLPEDASLPMIHARGQSIKAVQYSIATSIQQYGIQTVFIDSMSRSGMGSLKEDDVANAIIDILNSFGITWVLIAHSPRADSTHAFGSMMQEAGEDVGVQVAFDKQDDVTMGILLNITKTNDIPFSKQYWTMHFDIAQGLSGFESAAAKDYPELGNPDEIELKMKAIEHWEKVGQDSATSAAKTLRVNRGNLSKLLNQDEAFAKGPKIGREQIFILAE